MVLALEGDEIPNNALTRAYNTAFRSESGGKTAIGTRPGLDTINDTPLTDSPAILRGIPYSYDDGTQHQNYTAIIGNDGKLYYKEPDDDMSGVLAPPANFPYASGLAFTAGNYLIDGAVMNNSLFLVNTNGERRSLIGTTYEPFGLSPIATVAVAAAATGSAGMPAETYSISVTSYDDDPDEESSSSTPASVTLLAGERIKIDITPTASETAQYPYWRVYLRRNTTQSNLLRVLVLENVGGTTIVTDGNIPIATTTVYVDLSAAQIAAHVLSAPSITENNQPPTSVRFVESFAGRLLLADRRNIYWSNLGKPRGFPPTNTEEIETGEGDEVTGLHKFSDEICLIFTKTATLGLFGDDPQNWVLRPIDNSTGCVSHMSVVDYDKKAGWWSQEHGPVEFDGVRIKETADDYLGKLYVVDGVEKSRLNFIVAGRQPEKDRLVYGFTLDGSSRNDVSISYNYKVGRWESDLWDGIDPSAMFTAYDEDGVQRLFVGSYAGQLFKYNGNTKNDGIVSGTVLVENWIPSAATTSVIQGTGFYNSNGKLVERKVTVVDSENRPVARRRITSNTSTALTITPALTGLAIGGSYTVHVGGPDVRLYSKWYDFDMPFNRKRIDRLYLHARSSGESVEVQVATQVNFVDEVDDIADALTLGGGLWDAGIWDSAEWAGSPSIKRRLAIFRTAHAFRVVILHPQTNEDFVFTKLSALARVLDDRILA